MTTRHVLGAMLLLTFTACGLTEVETNDISNKGTACIQDGTARVDFNQCLSSSCDTLINASCTGTVDGTTLTITSSGSIESQRNPNSGCTTDCGFVVADCTVTGDLSAVTTIAYAGGETTTLDCTN